ncbi:HhH-GPD family protein [Hydrogenophilus thermoluteolus]|uniref:DNA-3-methyladenine glycosylase II n=2 Tax=Hydrogenophilus thermoluteolus TaxID=297 RepID=A0A2Z6DXH4_HYDTE|nr:HhH-GPD family protein [Hydrogenophilus thermoluteolus]
MVCDPGPEAWVRPPYWETACAELRARDPKMAELIAQYDGELLGSHGDPFVTLARAIVGQQVSVVAADRLWERFTAAVDGVVSPERVWAVEPEVLRGAGLSARKVEYLRDLARHAQEGSLDPERWAEMSDEAIIGALTAVRGIGRWTAEMFLIFHLLRPDVWPADDLGLRKALVARYGLPAKQPLAAWRSAGERFRPWRTVATWYLWRSLDPVAVAY